MVILFWAPYPLTQYNVTTLKSPSTSYQTKPHIEHLKKAPQKDSQKNNSNKIQHLHSPQNNPFKKLKPLNFKKVHNAENDVTSP